MLKIQRKLFQPFALLETIDGKSIRKLGYIDPKDGATLERNNTEEVELKPGTHSVEFRYVGSQAQSVTNATLVLDYKAGRSYELHVAPIDEGFTKALSRGVAGGYSYWTAWIIDAETKEVLAGEARTEPLHWYE